MAEYEFIKLESQGGVATLTLNRPEKRNAISDALRSELIDALERVAQPQPALATPARGPSFQTDAASRQTLLSRRRSEEISRAARASAS